MFLSGLISLIFISSNLFAQNGLDKTRKELLGFIKRPAYSNQYPNISEDKSSIICMSDDGNEIISYHFNKYDRCNTEMYGRTCNNTNFKSNWDYFESYLKACGYEKSLDADNKYVDKRTRTVAHIERTGQFLIILFKKY